MIQAEKPKGKRRWSSRIIESLIVVVALALTINFFMPEAPTPATTYAEPIVVIPQTANTNTVAAETLFEEALALIDNEDYEGALALVNLAIETDDAPSERYYWKQAWLLGQVRQHEAAITAYQTLLATGRNQAYALGGLCFNHGSLSNFAEATEYCEAVGDYSSHEQYSNDTMCYIHGFTGQYELALEECNNWIAKHAHPYAYNNRSRANLMLGNYEQTIRDATQAIYMNTDRPEMPYTNRGLARIALGQYSEGYADLMVAYGVDSTYPDIYLGLANYHYRMGSRDDALANYCRYMSMAWVTPSDTVLAHIQTLGGCGD
jgi:tetratricopeptide (TPR) repeat protein